jgi:hypothetical protein
MLCKNCDHEVIYIYGVWTHSGVNKDTICMRFFEESTLKSYLVANRAEPRLPVLGVWDTQKATRYWLKYFYEE